MKTIRRMLMIPLLTGCCCTGCPPTVGAFGTGTLISLLDGLVLSCVDGGDGG